MKRLASIFAERDEGRPTRPQHALFRPRSWTVIALGFALLVPLGGCGWWLRITEVSGSVKVDGKPAGGVQLVFDPLDKSRPRAMARTAADGSFQLGRQGPGDKSGAAAGTYIVRVMSDNDGGEGFRIPPEYNVRSTLEFDVVPGRANVFEIDVTTKPVDP